MICKTKLIADEKQILGVLDLHENCLRSLSKSDNYRKEMAKKFSDNAEFIVAEIEDNVVGFCALYANDTINQTAYISMIAVKREYRRHGIGQTLLNETIMLSREKGMKLIRLEVYMDNTTAVSFYKNNGFEIIGNKQNKTFLMSKKI